MAAAASTEISLPSVVQRKELISTPPRWTSICAGWNPSSTRSLATPNPSSRNAPHSSYGPAGLRAIAGIGREVEGRRKDGSVFPLDLSVAEWQRDGETFFTGIMRDISRRKNAESALAEGKALLANLYRQSGAGLAETDAAGRFVSVNDRYCEIVGRSREALLQLRLHDIAHPEDHQQNLPLFTRLVTAGGPHSIEERYVRGGQVLRAAILSSRSESPRNLCGRALTRKPLALPGTAAPL